MKKTLLITLDFPPKRGGVSTYLINLARHCAPEKLVVVAPFAEAKYQEKFKIYQNNFLINWKVFSWLPLFRHVYKIIKTDNIQKIWVAQPLPIGTVAMFFRLFFKIPYIVNLHGMDLHLACRFWRKKWLFKCILSYASGITVNSEYTAQELAKIGDFNEKAQVIYPCPTSRQNCDTSDIKVPSEYENLRDKPIILSVARLVERKGQDMVIKSLKKIIEKIPDVHYVMVGDGEYRDALEKLANNEGVSDHVTFMGEVSDSDLDFCYRNSKLFIMPSRNISGDVEGFGIVYLEAGSYGLPVIGGRSGGVVEAIVDNETGVLVDPNSMDEISSAVIKILRDENYSKKLGERGKQRVKKKFQWKISAEKFLKLLE